MIANYYSTSGLSLIQKLKLIWAIISSKEVKPIIKFNNGIELDFSKNRVVIHNPVEILAKENLTIASEKHLMLKSSKLPEERPGYNYSVWVNPIMDDEERPLKIIDVYDSNNEVKSIFLAYDKDNNLIIPEGYSINKRSKK